MGQLYATKEDMCQRFRLDDLNDLSENDDARLAAVLKTTSALIDGYIAPRYRLPLQNKHDVLTDAACDIAYYKMYYVDAAESVRQRYEDAIRLLKDIQSGKARLNEPTGSESSPQRKVFIKAEPRRFTNDMWQL